MIDYEKLASLTDQWLEANSNLKAIEAQIEAETKETTQAATQRATSRVTPREVPRPALRARQATNGKEDKNLTRPQAAKRIGVSVGTMNTWASKGGGPKFFKEGRTALYKQADVDAFKKAR